MLSDEKLKALWSDTNFKGSFSGGRTFQSFLKSDLNENVSLSRIYSVLKTIPSYQISQRPIRKFPVRQYDVSGFGQLIEADLAHMFEKNGFKYFLSVVDCFSHKIFAKALRSKNPAEVKNAFEKIFKEFGDTEISTLATDEGGEFVGLKEYFRKKKIRLIFKKTKNKARYAEHSIFLIKRKLFTLLRSKVEDNWPLYLSSVVENLNSKPQKSLGGIKPSEISSIFDDAKVRAAQIAKNLPLVHQPGLKPKVT